VKSDLVVVVMNGWGASSRRRKTRTSQRVEEELWRRDIEPVAMLARRAATWRSRVRKFRSFIRAQASVRGHPRDLLIVCKSYGAYLMLTEVLGRERPKYRRIALLTIDPCWPLLFDWKPNLNGRILFLDCPVDRAVNVYAVMPPDRQGGCLVTGQGCTNVPVVGSSHEDIVRTVQFKRELSRSIDFVMGL
jgi:hypothetical protein